jgi:hypothetical protein
VTGGPWPARYEVRVEGVLEGRWSEWFEGLEVERVGDDTILSGTLPDQPALHGILDKVRDLGLTLIAVRRLPPDEDPDETQSQTKMTPRLDPSVSRVPTSRYFAVASLPLRLVRCSSPQPDTAEAGTRRRSQEWLTAYKPLLVRAIEGLGPSTP